MHLGCFLWVVAVQLLSSHLMQIVVGVFLGTPECFRDRHCLDKVKKSIQIERTVTVRSGPSNTPRCGLLCELTIRPVEPGNGNDEWGSMGPGMIAAPIFEFPTWVGLCQLLRSLVPSLQGS
jgi:hypothetical protein